MTRNLKILIAAAMALAAFGALSATAHAAEEKFHCSVEPCRLTLAPDGTGTTTHRVFVVRGETTGGVKGASVSFTCDRLTGEATVAAKTTTEATFTNLKIENTASEDKCKIGAAEIVTFSFTSCDYTFTSIGGGTEVGSQFHLLCSTAGDSIDVNVNGTACLRVTPFTASGVRYHDAGTTKEVMTASLNVVVPAAAVELVNIGNANCAAVGLKAIESVSVTTGNTLVKAETDPGGETASVWFE